MPCCWKFSPMPESAQKWSPNLDDIERDLLLSSAQAFLPEEKLFSDRCDQGADALPVHRIGKFAIALQGSADNEAIGEGQKVANICNRHPAA